MEDNDLNESILGKESQDNKTDPAEEAILAKVYSLKQVLENDLDVKAMLSPLDGEQAISDEVYQKLATLSDKELDTQLRSNRINLAAWAAYAEKYPGLTNKQISNRAREYNAELQTQVKITGKELREDDEQFAHTQNYDHHSLANDHVSLFGRAYSNAAAKEAEKARNTTLSTYPLTTLLRKLELTSAADAIQYMGDSAMKGGESFLGGVGQTAAFAGIGAISTALTAAGVVGVGTVGALGMTALKTYEYRKQIAQGAAVTLIAAAAAPFYTVGYVGKVVLAGGARAAAAAAWGTVSLLDRVSRGVYVAGKEAFRKIPDPLLTKTRAKWDAQEAQDTLDHFIKKHKKEGVSDVNFERDLKEIKATENSLLDEFKSGRSAPQLQETLLKAREDFIKNYLKENKCDELMEKSRRAMDKSVSAYLKEADSKELLKDKDEKNKDKATERAENRRKFYTSVIEACAEPYKRMGLIGANMSTTEVLENFVKERVGVPLRDIMTRAFTSQKSEKIVATATPTVINNGANKGAGVDLS